VSRSRRTDSVLRVRALQERVAEAEAVHRRRILDRHRTDLEIAQDDLAARTAAVHEISSLAGLLGHRHRTEAAATEIERRSDRLDLAADDHERAEVVWHESHQRHEAVCRLDERLRAAAAEDLARSQQLELDDLVIVRHARDASRGQETT